MGDLIRVVDMATPDLQKVLDKMPSAVDVALLRVGLIVQSAAVRQTNRIAGVPIPTRAQLAAYNRKGGRRAKRVGGGGAKAWNRTGGLVQAIQGGLESKRGQVSLTADVPYALSRHELGVSWQPRNPALGIMRKRPFFAQAVEITEPQILPAFTAALNAELGL